MVGRCLVWLRRRPLELRMPPAISHRRKRTRRTQRAHSVSRKGPRCCLPCCDDGKLAQSAQGSKAVARRCDKSCMPRHALRTWRRQPFDRPRQNNAAAENAAVQYRCTERFVPDLSEGQGNSPQFEQWNVRPAHESHSPTTMCCAARDAPSRARLASGARAVDSNCSRVRRCSLRSVMTLARRSS